MAFTESIVKQAWERSGGQCECRRRTHSHFYIPCGKQLRWEVRGKASQGGWESHQTRIGGGDTLENCEILCWQCHDTIY